MRARDTVFHVPCFSCTVCMAVLTKGDQFGMHDGAVFCQNHYHQFASSSVGPSSSSSNASSPLIQQQRSSLSAQLRTTLPPSMTPTMAQSPYSSRALESPVPGTFYNGSSTTGGGTTTTVSAPTQPRQKGRPRKRKPKDLDAITANMGEYIISYIIIL